MPWYAQVHWFECLAQEGWAGALHTLPVEHPEAALLPLVSTSPGGATGLSNYYSPLLETVDGAPLHDPEGLARAWARAGVHRLDLRPLHAEAAWWPALRVGLHKAGFVSFVEPAFGNWVLDVAGQDAATYLAHRAGSLRTSWARGRKRLTRAGDWSIEVVTALGAALEAALQDYERVYAQSWKGAEGAPNFLRTWARHMAAQGQLRLGVLRLNGEPLAAQIWFVQAGVAYIFKLAYAEGREAFSPGTVLTAHLMAHVIDRDRVHTVDFLSGDDAYKRDWMSHRRQRLALVAYRWAHPRGGWGALQHLAARGWRRLQSSA